MRSWLLNRRDPFTRNISLNGHAPFSFDHDEAVRFQGANGSHWLVLDSIYAGRRGTTVHVARPSDLELGGGMDNFAENLAEAVRQLDPAAIAVFSYWPREPDDSDPNRQPPIRRLSFELCAQGPSGPGRHIHRRRGEPLSHPKTGGPVRYQNASFYHLRFEDVAQLLGPSLLAESPTEVVIRAHHLSRWADLAADVTLANQESWDTFQRQFGEWNVA